MSELKPCPFCGKTPVLGKWGKLHVVIHRDCKFIDSFSDVPNGDGFGASGRTEEEAIEHWNTRAERTCGLRSRFTGMYCYECSECRSGMKHDWSFCPTCGAKVMRDAD